MTLLDNRTSNNEGVRHPPISISSMAVSYAIVLTHMVTLHWILFNAVNNKLCVFMFLSRLDSALFDYEFHQQLPTLWKTHMLPHVVSCGHCVN